MEEPVYCSISHHADLPYFPYFPSFTLLLTPERQTLLPQTFFAHHSKKSKSLPAGRQENCNQNE
jgi:hypothetical protein